MAQAGSSLSGLDFSLHSDWLRQVRRREGRYPLRTNPMRCGCSASSVVVHSVWNLSLMAHHKLRRLVP